MTKKNSRHTKKHSKRVESTSGNPGGFSPTAIPREVWRLTSGWLTHASVGLPWRLARAAVSDSSLVPWGDGKVYMIVGEALLSVIDAWGPLYGKAAQVWLSRLGKNALPVIDALKLDRVYGDWPPMPWQDVQAVRSA